MSDVILTTDALVNLLRAGQFARRVTALHWHHTWKPSHKDYTGKNGLALQASMREYHTQVNGWSDIGQHLTLLPDGLWVTGRDFNRDPASIAGHNAGALAVEMLGNFDTGHDKLQGRQLGAAVQFGAAAEKLLGAEHIFHREYAAKTCPGTGIDKAWFVGLIKAELEGDDVKVDKTVIKYQGKDLPGVIIDGVSYAPVRQLAAALGKTVTWDGKTVRIN